MGRIWKIGTREHDVIFLCDTDIPYDDTWDRSGDVKRKAFQQRIINDLESRQLKYHLLQGSVEARIAEVEKVLQSYKKY